MITKDINIFESGSGGEFSIISNDLTFGETLYNQVYLALFGGNLEAETRGDELPNEERNDWFGNSLIYPENPNKQFNSITEKTLKEIVLNSSGRIKLIKAIETDLSYLSDLLNFSVNVNFQNVNSIVIIVNFTKKGENENKVLQLVYDNAKNELIIDKVI